jgi:hypothetical protein
MKANIFLITLILIGFIGCNKTKEITPAATLITSFEQIKMANIQALDSKLSGNTIQITNNMGSIWKPGDVFIFKTNENKYGKFKVITIVSDVDYRLIIDAVLFNDDGKEKLSKEKIVIRGTWLCDLDLLSETDLETKSDFHWKRATLTDTEFKLKNGAKIARFLLP